MSFDPRVYCSEHLSWKELACHDLISTPYPLDWRETRGRSLGMEFERIRRHAGGRILINSAYRTPEYNTSVGGVVASQHVEGRALDLAPIAPMSWDELHEAVIKAAHEQKSLVRYIKWYPSQGFVHVDIRPTETLAMEWYG